MYHVLPLTCSFIRQFGFISVGPPIPTTQHESPSQTEIDHVHQMYMGTLTKLFDKHKVQFGISEDAQLEFV